MPKIMFESFNRYRPIIDNWEAFLEASSQPLPTCLWINPLRTTRQRVVRGLEQAGFAPEDVPWYEGAYRLSNGVSPGTTVEYLAGLLHIQEEIALAPAMLLDPQPGERVLDLCAAPGNKTAQMAFMMRNTGTVVANDCNMHRMRALRRVINRLGLVNVSTTLYNAANYPGDSHGFDRVLVDVPCSCEGTCRKNQEVLTKSAQVGTLQGLQTAILRRGLHLCKPGGRVVYSTCTYAPEENEVVVQKALDSLAPKIQAKIAAVELPGLEWSPGLLKWRDMAFRADMQNSLRVYPHQNDTGGFFIAVIDKIEDANPKGSGDRTSHVATDDDVEQMPWLGLLEERFGISGGSFAQYSIFRSNAKMVSLVNRDHKPPDKPRPQSIGIPFVKTDLKYPKLTTAAAMAFGASAQKNMIQASKQQAEMYLSGGSFEVDGTQNGTTLTDGYVLITFDDIVLGVGLYFRKEGRGVVHSMFPKAWQIR